MCRVGVPDFVALALAVLTGSANGAVLYCSSASRLIYATGCASTSRKPLSPPPPFLENLNALTPSAGTALMCDPGCSSRGSRCHGYRGYPDGRKHSAGYKGVLHFASMGVCVNATNTYNGLMHRDYKLACKEYTHWEIRKQVYGIVAAAGAVADAAADSGCSAVLEDFCRIIDGHIFLAIFSGACAPLWAVVGWMLGASDDFPPTTLLFVHSGTLMGRRTPTVLRGSVHPSVSSRFGSLLPHLC